MLHDHAYEQTLFEKNQQEFVCDGKIVFVGDLLTRAYKKFADKIALVDDEITYTYKDLYARSLIFAQKLAENDIQPGDHVVLLFENSPEFFISYWAVWLRGAVVIPLNTFLHPKEVGYILAQACPKVIISSESLKPLFEKTLEQGFIDSLPIMLSGNDIDCSSSFPDQVNTSAQVDFSALDSEKTCLILFTSGTTGNPKGVMLSSKNIITNVLQAHARFHIALKRDESKDQDRFFCVLPLFHVFAQNTCLWLPLVSGDAVIIVRKIDRKLILKGLQKKPTVFFGFPALYGLLCLMKNAPLDSIKIFVSGADALPDKIRMGFGIIYGRKICSGYGLTEAAPVVAINYHNEEMPTNVVGFPVSNLMCEIRDDAGHKVAFGNIGTLWIKGDNIMQGYYKAPEETAKILQDGWLNTGDLATITNNGCLSITGRSKDLIIHKGFNIYPQEIENVLMTHPMVFKAAVIGKKEEASGEIAIAYVAVKTLDDGTRRSLQQLCKNNLAGYKIPKKFICLDDLPMNATGKVDKKQLENR